MCACTAPALGLHRIARDMPRVAALGGVSCQVSPLAFPCPLHAPSRVRPLLQTLCPPARTPGWRGTPTLSPGSWTCTATRRSPCHLRPSAPPTSPLCSWGTSTATSARTCSTVAAAPLRGAFDVRGGRGAAAGGLNRCRERGQGPCPCLRPRRRAFFLWLALRCLRLCRFECSPSGTPGGLSNFTSKHNVSCSVSGIRDLAAADVSNDTLVSGGQGCVCLFARPSRPARTADCRRLICSVMFRVDTACMSGRVAHNACVVIVP
jgi:hypothetical protein